MAQRALTAKTRVRQKPARSIQVPVNVRKGAAVALEAAQAVGNESVLIASYLILNFNVEVEKCLYLL